MICRVALQELVSQRACVFEIEKFEMSVYSV